MRLTLTEDDGTVITEWEIPEDQISEDEAVKIIEDSPIGWTED